MSNVLIKIFISIIIIVIVVIGGYFFLNKYVLQPADKLPGAILQGGTGISVENVNIDLVGGKYIVSIYANKSSGVLFITENGLSIFDGSKWKKVNEGNLDPKIFKNIYHAVMDDNFNVLFSTYKKPGMEEEGLYRMVGNEWVKYNKNNGLDGFIEDIAVDSKSGDIWVATEEEVCVIKAGDNFCESMSEGITQGVLEDVKLLVVDKEGNVFGGGYVGLWKLIDGKWQNLNPEGSTVTKVEKLAVDDKGNIWIGTKEKGLFKYNLKNEQWINYITENGLGLPLDEEMKLLLKLSGQKEPPVTSLAVSKNKIFVGTFFGGISVFDGVSWHIYTTKDGLLSNEVTSLAADSNGNLWIGYGTEEGLTKIQFEK